MVVVVQVDALVRVDLRIELTGATAIGSGHEVASDECVAHVVGKIHYVLGVAGKTTSDGIFVEESAPYLWQ